MIDLSKLLMVIWFMESSCGENMNHPQPNCHGHYGMSDIAIRDVNERCHTRFSADEMDNHATATIAARMYIGMYFRKHSEWTVNDILLFWRCGIVGMNSPTQKQVEYMDEGIRRYEMLLNGDKNWNKGK